MRNQCYQLTREQIKYIVTETKELTWEEIKEGTRVKKDLAKGFRKCAREKKGTKSNEYERVAQMYALKIR